MTAHRWWSCFQAEGELGLHARPSVAHRPRHRMLVRLERRVVRLPRQHKWERFCIAPHAGLPVSTVLRVLVRHGLHRLEWMKVHGQDRAPLRTGHTG